MRKRRFYLLLIAVVALIGVLLAVLSGPREPEYKGRKLSEWVEKYAVNLQAFPGDPEPERAIRQIGTNAVPYLLKWMLYDTPPWKDRVYSAVNRMARVFSAQWRVTDNKRLGARKFGFIGMFALGPAARGAIPDLIRAAKDPEARGATFAGGVLEMLGSEAVPALVASLTNQEKAVRLFAAKELKEFGTNAWPAMPALTKLLTDPDLAIRSAATNTLRAIDPQVLESGWAR